MDIQSCENLENLSLPNLKIIDSSITLFRFVGNALNQQSVDGILAKLVEIGYSNGTVDLSGGTNASPSAQGLLDVATLVSNGCTVNVN